MIVQILESGYRFVLGSIGGGKFLMILIIYFFLHSHEEKFWNSKLINLINKNDWENCFFNLFNYSMKNGVIE